MILGAVYAAEPLPEKVACAIADRQDFQQPDRVHLTGWIGSRMDASEKNRLVKIDPNRLLLSYHNRPGCQSYDCEHIGKWLHAATLAWVNSGDPALRQKLDLVATGLVKCQLEDGYLGTYSLDGKPWARWTEWDVWTHKYNLLGLISYVRHTGNMDLLPACRKVGDLLCKTFGDEPGKLDINVSSAHVGMASGSVLEPMVLLYRMTGEQRYLDFAKYLLRAWEQPNGPKIVSRLLELKRVDKVGNAKAYEMLSCINGIIEMYRTTGDGKLLEVCRNAWQDIVDKRLYLSGSTSYREHFHDDFDLSNCNKVGEACVTVSWLQLNKHLLRLTGEARFAEQLEKTVFNHLFAAQLPDGTAWAYFTMMEGKKPYTSSTSTPDVTCCLSSGPRGVALIPTFSTSVDADGVVMNLYDAGTAKLTLRNGKPVMLTTETIYPSDGRIVITVEPESSARFTLKARIPAWCRESAVKVNGKSVKADIGKDGYAAIKRKWAKGDKLELDFNLEPRVIVGDHKNEGKIAIMYGPLVLAADEALLGTERLPIRAVSISKPDLAALAIKPEPAPEKVKTWPHALVFHCNVLAREQPQEIRLIPFADAGSLGQSYKIWLPLCRNVLADGTESRSRKGDGTGSINDEDDSSFVNTSDGTWPKEDWYAVTLPEAKTIARVVFIHGKTVNVGGWFDASTGKPRIQIQTSSGGAWEDAGELKDYPATTGSNAGPLNEGESFSCQLAAPVKVFGVRVLGKPAFGGNPNQAFSSCAELQTFNK
jgi:hypothetical protein